MKTLKHLIPLSHKVTIYVPATDAHNNAIDNTPYVEKTAAILCSMFGGATASPALGFWMSDKNGLVKENTTIVFAFAKTLTDENIDSICEICEDIKLSLGQDAVAVEINSQMYFI